MSRPRILDLFCCEGGAAVGYDRAGFEVVGVDLEPRFAKRYPFEFHAADAIEFVKEHGHEFDAIHASPPCQAYSITRHGHGRQHPKLIEPTRDALIASGLPYVIENVEGAPLIDPTVLCWGMFHPAGSVIDDDGTPLRMERHRLFESNIALTAPAHVAHDRSVQVAGSYGGARRDKREAREVRHGGYVPAAAIQQQLLGIDWMTQHGMHQSLPPVYTTWVGLQLRAALLVGGAA
jgi:DNA (cytosine-5)-methyltransferase 1